MNVGLKTPPGGVNSPKAQPFGNAGDYFRAWSGIAVQ